MNLLQSHKWDEFRREIHQLDNAPKSLESTQTHFWVVCFSPSWDWLITKMKIFCPLKLTYLLKIILVFEPFLVVLRFKIWGFINIGQPYLRVQQTQRVPEAKQALQPFEPSSYTPHTILKGRVEVIEHLSLYHVWEEISPTVNPGSGIIWGE